MRPEIVKGLLVAASSLATLSRKTNSSYPCSAGGTDFLDMAEADFGVRST